MRIGPIQVNRMAIDRKVALGYGLGIISSIFLLCYCFNIESPMINLLLVLFGGLLGWVTGILATPVDRAERKLFSTYVAAISTFLSGFVVAKLDRLFEEGLAQNAFTQLVFQRLLLFASAFLLGCLFTFVGRLYVKDQPLLGPGHRGIPLNPLGLELGEDVEHPGKLDAGPARASPPSG